jgi:hypothetical protein
MVNRGPHNLPSPGGSGPRLIFLGNVLLILFDLQTLKLHRICFVHANEVIKISLGSLDVYLSDGIGLIILGAM